MSYGTKYFYRWITPTGRRRVNVQLRDYAGSATEVTPSEPALHLEWGRPGGEDLYLPLMVSEAVLRVHGNDDGELLRETFDASPREWRVQTLVDPEGGTSYDLEWTGFLTGELWQDDPYSPSEAIELQAVDGLALLNRISELEGEVSLLEAVMDALYDLDLEVNGGDLPVVLNQEFYPYTDPPVTDQPLEWIEVVAENVFREDGDPDETERLDLRAQLEAVLERFSLQLVQAEGTWHIRQRHRIDPNGDLKVWTYEGPFTTTSTKNLTRELPAIRREGSARPRSGVQRLSTLESVYEYDEMGQLVRNGGFEAGWDGWAYSASGGALVSLVDYDDTALTLSSTQENQQVALLEATGDPTTSVPHLQQTAPAIIPPHGPGVDLTFAYDLAVGWASVGSRTRPTTKLRVGSYYLRAREVEVRQSALAAQEGVLYVQPIAPEGSGRIIPKGQVLPVYATKTGNPQIATVTLTEPVYAGDPVLKGQISSDVDLSEYDGPSESVRVVYWTWTGTETMISDPDHLQAHPAADPMLAGDEDNSQVSLLTPQTISVPLSTPTGQLVTGQPEIEFSMLFTLSSDNRVWIDGVSLLLTKEGEPLDETRFIATTGEDGRSLELTHPMGDGPVANHPRALVPLGSEGLSSGWKIGPYAGEVSTDTGLEELTATTQLRWQRYSMDRRTYTCELRAGDELLPHYVYEEDGTQYTVSYLRRTYGTSEETGRVELTELRDGGANGIVQAFSVDSSRTRSAGRGRGGGGTYIISGGDGGPVDWHDILNVPALVNTIGGQSGSILLSGALDMDGDTLGINLAEELTVEDGALTIATNSITDDHLAYPLTAVDIDGGAVDGTTIGQTTPAPGTFTRVNTATEAGSIGAALRSVDQDVDFDPLVIGDRDAYEYGYHWEYAGSGSGIDSRLTLFAHDEDSGPSTASRVYVLRQDGAMRIVRGIWGGVLRPAPGENVDLGSSINRWDALYAGAGNFAGDVVPDTSYSYDLGTPVHKWRSASIGELNVSLLTVREEATTTGGRLFTGFGNVLAADFNAAETSIVVEHNNIQQGSILKLEARGDFEFVRVNGYTVHEQRPLVNDVKLDSAHGDVTDDFPVGESMFLRRDDGSLEYTLEISGAVFDGTRTIVSHVGSAPGSADVVLYVGDGPYTYLNVERDLDTTDADDWDAGDGVQNTGVPGTGFIDQYAINSLLDGQGVAGPGTAYMLRTGIAYNAIEPRAVVGNLNGWYGYSEDRFGLAAGIPDGEHIKVDDGTGITLVDGFGNDTIRIFSNAMIIGRDDRNRMQFSSLGINLEDESGDTIASWLSDQITLGRVTSEHLILSPSVGLRLFTAGGDVAAQVSGDTLSIGNNFLYNAATNALSIDGYATESYADGAGQGAIDYLESEYPLASISSKATEAQIANALQDGTIISGGYINTNLLDVENIFAQNVSVEARLEMGSSGVITNDEDDFRVDEDGFAVKGTSLWAAPAAYSVVTSGGAFMGGLGALGSTLTIRSENNYDLSISSEEDLNLSAQGSLSLNTTGTLSISPGLNQDVQIGRSTSVMKWMDSLNVLALPRRFNHPPTPPSDEVYLYGLYDSEHSETQFWIRESDGSTIRLVD